MRFIVKFYDNKQHSCNNVLELTEYLHDLPIDELRKICDIKTAASRSLHLCEKCAKATNVTLPLAIIIDDLNLPIYKLPICDKCLCNIVGKVYVYRK